MCFYIDNLHFMWNNQDIVLGDINAFLCETSAFLVEIHGHMGPKGQRDIFPGRDGIGAGLGRKFFSCRRHRRRRRRPPKRDALATKTAPAREWHATQPALKVQGS